MLQIKKREPLSPIPPPRIHYQFLTTEISRVEALLNETIDHALIDALSYELLALNQRRKQCFFDAKEEQLAVTAPRQREVAAL